MTQPHFFSKAPADVAWSRIAVFGPLDDRLHVPEGQQPQKLKFNLAGGKTANCELKAGETYAILLEMFGERGATLACKVQDAAQTAPPKTVATFKIPSDYDRERTQRGYAFVSVIHFDT